MTKLDDELQKAYAKYLEGCEKRSAPVIWNFHEWQEGSIIAAMTVNEFWTTEDGHEH